MQNTKKKSNCINCGAVINYDYDKCEYCKTPYDKPKKNANSHKCIELTCDDDILSPSRTVILNVRGKKMRFYTTEIECEYSPNSYPIFSVRLTSMGGFIDE